MFSLLSRCILAQPELETLRTPCTLFDCSREKLKCYLQKFSHTFNLVPMHAFTTVFFFFFFLGRGGGGGGDSLESRALHVH